MVENAKSTKNLQIANMVSSYWYIESDANVRTNKNLLP